MGGGTANPVQHFLIPFDDPQRAEHFYKEVFGWDVHAAGGLNDDYHAAGSSGGETSSGTINGGLFQRGRHGLDHITVVLQVVSIEDCIKRIEAAGCAVVLPKTPVSDTGYYAQVTDSEDNVLGLWESKRKDGV